jgi:hypothetical protein
MDAEFTEESQTGPHGRSLLIFGHTDTLACKIARVINACISPDEDLGMEESAASENGQRRPSSVTFRDTYQERCERQLRYVELRIMELPPE